jgi:hypothetical protein
MRPSSSASLLSACLILLLLSFSGFANAPLGEAAKLLPNKLGDTVAQGKSVPPFTWSFEEDVKALAGIDAAASRVYVAPSGERYIITVFRARTDSEAYSLLTFERWNSQGRPDFSIKKVKGVGTDADAYPGRIVFFKGAILGFINGKGSINDLLPGQPVMPEDGSEFATLARKFAESLDAGSGEIPPLVKHLPDWETAEARALYVLTQPGLAQAVPNQPALDAVSFDGGTEAVVATYDGGGRLVIVEYATPQIASDADARIKTRIAALPGEGKPAPSAYRRVGNYAVFVFDAPDERAAAGLIDKVKYEKDVRWLGDNPYAVERANRAWLNMSTSVIVNTVKAAGLAIVLCLAIGGIFGGWIFTRRRAQAAHSEKFSDAGGMVRLNIDEISAQNNAASLVGRGDK